jgi:hypothetical protein
MGRYMVTLLETLQETQRKADTAKQQYIFLVKQSCFKECKHTKEHVSKQKLPWFQEKGWKIREKRSKCNKQITFILLTVSKAGSCR